MCRIWLSYDSTFLQFDIILPLALRHWIMYQSIHKKLFGSYITKLPVMTVLRRHWGNQLKIFQPGLMRKRIWLKLIFLTGLRLNAKCQQLLPPTLTEKSFSPPLRQFVRKTASATNQIQGQRSNWNWGGPSLIHHELHHNKVVILLLGVFGQSLVILFAVEWGV